MVFVEKPLIISKAKKEKKRKTISWLIKKEILSRYIVLLKHPRKYKDPYL